VTGFSLVEIGKALNASVVGNGDLVVIGAAEPGAATVNQLAVAMTPRFTAMLAKGAARAAILNIQDDWQAFGLQGAILVDHPRLAMAGLTRLLKAPPPQGFSGIHPTALIDPSATIAKDAIVAPYSVIGPDTCIGAGAQIGPHVSIAGNSSIGKNCVLAAGTRIGSNVRIGARFTAHFGVCIGADGFSFVSSDQARLEIPHGTTAQDSADRSNLAWLKIHSIGGVQIGDDVEIGANSNVDAGTIRATFINHGTKIDALVQVGHNVRIGRNCLLCAHVAVGGSAELGHGVILGGQAGVGDNIWIGDGVIAGGASKILSNVPAGRAILGYPATKKETHVESYKALRRLPKFMRDIKRSEKN